MILYIFVAAASVLLGLLVNHCDQVRRNGITRQQMLNGLSLSAIFLLLFGVSACRLNVGNDYAKYVEFMHLINCNAFVPTEFGFNQVVKLLYGISGFENYLLVFAFFAFFTILIFLMAIYRQADSFPFSFFLFMALGYYFQSFNTVRYYLALAVALYSMKFVMRRQWGRFVVLVLLGSAFHKSLLVVIPLYFLASLAWKKWQLAIAALFCTTFLFMQDYYLKLVVFLYPTYEDTEYLEGGTSYISILRCGAVLLFAGIVYLMRKKETARRSAADYAGSGRSGEEALWNRRFWFYFYLNLGALILYVFCSFLPIISRIGYYLMVSQILYLPMLLEAVPSRKWRRLFRMGIILAAVLYFAMYLRKGAGDGVLILPYRTFFFHDMVNILSDVN